MIYQIGEIINFLQLTLGNDGLPANGEILDISIYNMDTGAKLVDQSAMTESPIGVHRYSWNSGITVNTSLLYYIKNDKGDVFSSKSFRVVTNKQDLISEIQSTRDAINENIDTGEATLS